jgi:endonuclease III
MSKGLLTLRQAVKLLRQRYGPPAPPPSSDPFELILWENVAYLASPTRRREAFEQLKRTVGTNPGAILAAEPSELESVTARGILKESFADKLRECARILVEDFSSDLGKVIQGPINEAKKALRSFPGIGEPGAEKILLFTGQQALLAPESNGLRVLVRLGVVPEAKSYSKMYAASRKAAEALPADPAVLQEAHLLLQKHGQTLCKRSAPSCELCPLAPGCAYFHIEVRRTPVRTRRSAGQHPGARTSSTKRSRPARG